MSEGKNIRYTYDSIEDWEKQNDAVQKIFKEADVIPLETKSLPPIGMLHDATQDIIDKLKKLSGLTVTVIED